MKLILGLLFVFSSGVVQASTPHPSVCYINHASTANYTINSNLASAASGDRKCMVIQNRNAAGGSSIYVRFNEHFASTTGTDGIEIPGGAVWEPNFVPSNNIYIKAFAGVVSATIMTGKGLN